MQLTEKIILVSCTMAFLAILNWIAGTKSITGENLQTRTSGHWVIMRWLGLGLFISSAVLHKQSELKSACIMALGSGIMLIGTARRLMRDKTVKQNIEQTR